MLNSGVRRDEWIAMAADGQLAFAIKQPWWVAGNGATDGGNGGMGGGSGQWPKPKMTRTTNKKKS